jgi:hypothetical protein
MRRVRVLFASMCCLRPAPCAMTTVILYFINRWRSKALTWLLRTLFVWLMCANVAVGLASILYFREATEFKSFIYVGTRKRRH